MSDSLARAVNMAALDKRRGATAWWRRPDELRLWVLANAIHVTGCPLEGRSATSARRGCTCGLSAALDWREVAP